MAHLVWTVRRCEARTHLPPLDLIFGPDEVCFFTFEGDYSVNILFLLRGLVHRVSAAESRAHSPVKQGHSCTVSHE